MSRLFSWFRRRTPESKPTTESAATSPPAVPVTTWHVLGETVRGASHERSGAPNQDAIRWWCDEATGLPIILAVADGHGSAKCFRSDIGAKFAVETAVATLRERLFDGGERDLTTIKRGFEERIPQELERHWKAAVQQHLAEHPLLVDEVQRVEAELGESARKLVEQQPTLAYGTTLLVIVVQADYFACLQIGDGDIVSVDDSGEASRPIAEDTRLLANETTSLAGDQAWREFRVSFQSLSGRPPALLLASTDGYSNSFSTGDGFLAVGNDLIDLLAEEGAAEVARNLPDWLNDASRQGSGDDVTLGVIWRADAVEARQRALPTTTADSTESSSAIGGSSASPA